MACENQIIKATDASGLIRIGVWDTLNVRSQQFDISDWLEQFPGGTLSVLHQRSGDTLPYMVAGLEVGEDGIATWTFDEIDSAMTGYGSASLRYQVGDEYKARSVAFPTYTVSTVGESGVEPPSPWDDWLERVVAASVAAQEAAESAEASETAAGESAAQASASASSAQDSATSAAASEATASQAAATAQAAQQAAETAQSGAQTAQTAAEAAQTAAEQAEAGAETAQSAAEAAETSATASATAAANSAAEAAASAASVDAEELNRRILAAFPTASAGPAAVVSVDDGADGIPIKSLSVAVEPVQSGSGTPSPDNVRPISGWNALNVNISPTQDAADGQTYSFPFSTTQYGGTFELTYDGAWAAKMAVDRVLASISDFGWSYSRQSAFFWVKFNAMKLAAPVIASAYNYVGAVTDGNMASVATGSIAVAPSTASDPYLKIKDTRYTAVADFVSAMGAETVCYELATPTEITWTQEQLLEILGADGFCTLLGVNNVWADAGETSMTYRQDVGILIGKLTAALNG